MPNPRALSGRSAILELQVAGGVSEVFLPAENWSLDIGRETEVYNSQGGLGWQQTVALSAGGTGQFQIVVSVDVLLSALAVSGDLVKLTLLSDKDGDSMSGVARIGRFNYTADRAGGPQRMTVPFQTDGPWVGTLTGDIDGSGNDDAAPEDFDAP